MNNENIELFCSDFMKQKFKKFCEVDYQKHHDLKVEYIKNGVICPIEIPEGGFREYNNYGGVLYEDLSFCELSRPKRFEGDSHVKEPKWYTGAREDLKPQDIEYIDEEVFFIGPLKKSIGHFMIEMFSFAWFLLNPENLKKYKVVYLLNGSEEPDWDIINTFYGGIGIDLENNFITVNKPTRFKKVVVAEQAMELQGKYHPVIKELLDKVKENIKPAPYKKIYFSKLASRFHANIGEKLAVKLLKQNGFKILCPELMTMKECIAALKGCEVFAAQSGSNAHQAFLLNDNVKCIIFNRSSHVHPTNLIIDEMRNLKTIYIDSCQFALPVYWDLGPHCFKATPYLFDFLKKHKFKYSKKYLIKETRKLFDDYLNKYLYWYYECLYTHERYKEMADSFIHFSEKDIQKLLHEFYIEFSEDKELTKLLKKEKEALSFKRKISKMFNIVIL